MKGSLRQLALGDQSALGRSPVKVGGLVSERDASRSVADQVLHKRGISAQDVVSAGQPLQAAFCFSFASSFRIVSMIDRFPGRPSSRAVAISGHVGVSRFRSSALD